MCFSSGFYAYHGKQAGYYSYRSIIIQQICYSVQLKAPKVPFELNLLNSWTSDICTEALTSKPRPHKYLASSKLNKFYFENIKYDNININAAWRSCKSVSIIFRFHFSIVLFLFDRKMSGKPVYIIRFPQYAPFNHILWKTPY